MSSLARADAHTRTHSLTQSHTRTLDRRLRMSRGARVERGNGRSSSSSSLTHEGDRGFGVGAGETGAEGWTAGAFGKAETLMSEGEGACPRHLMVT
jgi:hypothetical protein